MRPSPPPAPLLSSALTGPSVLVTSKAAIKQNKSSVLVDGLRMKGEAKTMLVPPHRPPLLALLRKIPRMRLYTRRLQLATFTLPSRSCSNSDGLTLALQAAHAIVLLRPLLTPLFRKTRPR